MPISTVTSKGQVTIPKKIRDRLGLKAGDKLDFQFEGDGSIRVHPVSKRVSEVFGAFREKAAKRLSEAQVKGRLRTAFRKGKL